MMPDHAWAAGYIDADGSISIARTHRTRAMPTYIPIVSAVSVDRRSLDALVDLYGGRVRSGVSYHKTGRPVWRWSIQGQSAIDAITSFGEALVLKQTQAWLAREAWAQQQSVAARIHGKRERGSSAYELPDEVIALREGYRLAMQIANRSRYLEAA